MNKKKHGKNCKSINANSRLPYRVFQRFLWCFEWAGKWFMSGLLYGFTSMNLKRTRTLKGDKDNLVIIANGPSIANCMEQIMSHKNDCDYACMNYFPIKSESFDILKPKFMFAVDMMFFDKNYKYKERRDNTVLLKKKLQNIDWPMVLFLRHAGSFELNNDKMKEIQINMTQIGGVYSRFRGWLFDKGIALPISATVSVAAIMLGTKMGYKNIYVYGIDQSYHENIRVDDNNHTIPNLPHFYKENGTQDINFDIGAIFWDSYRSIMGYRMLEEYAKARGVKIYNCTPGSYVDAFERK